MRVRPIHCYFHVGTAQTRIHFVNTVCQKLLWNRNFDRLSKFGGIYRQNPTQNNCCNFPGHLQMRSNPGFRLDPSSKFHKILPTYQLSLLSPNAPPHVTPHTLEESCFVQFLIYGSQDEWSYRQVSGSPGWVQMFTSHPYGAKSPISVQDDATHKKILVRLEPCFPYRYCAINLLWSSYAMVFYVTPISTVNS